MNAGDAPGRSVLKHARDLLLEVSVVHAVTIIEDDGRYHGRATLRLTLAEGIERVSPRILKLLYNHDLGVVDVTPQSGFLTVLAT